MACLSCLISCCLPAPCRRLAKNLWKRVWGSDDKSCGTKLAMFAFKTATNFLVSVLFLYLLGLIFFRPYQVHPTARAAVLSTFKLDGNALSYKLTLDLAFYNGHRISSIRFDHLTVAAYYNGTKLGGSSYSDGHDELPSRFTLRPRRDQSVHPVLSGRTTDISNAMAEQFSSEQKREKFILEVVVKTTLTYKFWPIKEVYYKEYNCWLTFVDPDKHNTADGSQEITGRDIKCGAAK